MAVNVAELRIIEIRSGFRMPNLNGRYHLKVLGIDMMIILK